MQPERNKVEKRTRGDNPREVIDPKDAQPSPVPPPPPPPPDRDDCRYRDPREDGDKEPIKNLDPTSSPPPSDRECPPDNGRETKPKEPIKTLDPSSPPPPAEGGPGGATYDYEPLEYLEFRLQIGRGSSGGYEAEVQQAPAGRGREPIELPCDVEVVEGTIKQLHRKVTKDRPSRVVAQELDSTCGARIFSALFHGEVRSSYDKSVSGLRGLAAAGKEQGLRIRLVGSAEDLARVGSQPWEYAYDAAIGGLVGRLACDRLTPLVRTLGTPRFIPPLEVEPPLRILVVDCVPDDQNPLETEEERNDLRAAIEHAKVARVVPLVDPTISELRRHLLRVKPHILHFIGHGGFDAERGDGYLCLAGEDGNTDPLWADELGQMLAAVPQLRLVFLNACRTAQFPRYNGQDPWSATSAAILRAGVASVIGMQFPIADSAAIAFSAGFYRALREGDPLEAAVVEGRVEIQRTSVPWEWGIPVLYLNTEDGQLFSPPAGTAGKSRGEAPEPLKLGIRSFIGWGRDMRGRVDQMLPLDSYFDGRFIRDPKLWAERVAPKLSRFLKRWVKGDRAVELEMAAHQTLAFLTGFLLEAKRGVSLSLLQRTGDEIELWQAKKGDVPKAPLWMIEEKDLGTPDGDVAVAIGITRPVAGDVEHYLQAHKIPIGRLLSLRLPEGYGQDVVKSGAHANALAQELSNRIDSRTPEEKARTLHILGSAPNGFFVYLGTKARGFGAIQLYEYDLEKTGNKTYQPSLRLPLGKA